MKPKAFAVGVDGVVIESDVGLSAAEPYQGVGITGRCPLFGPCLFQLSLQTLPGR
jgi:hypothetical protein